MNNQQRICEISALKNSIKELRAELHASIATLQAAIDLKRDGRDGAKGKQGEQGPPGPVGLAGRNAEVLPVGSDRLQAVRTVLESVLKKMAQEGK